MGYIECFNFVFCEFIKVVVNEEVVVFEVCCYSFYFDWVNDVFVVLDLMIYDIDFVLELVKVLVVWFVVVGGCSVEGLIDYVNVILGFENGVVVSFMVSKMSYCKICSFSVYCCLSLVEIDFFNYILYIYCWVYEWYLVDYGELLYWNDGFIEEVSMILIELFYVEFEYFL